MIRAALLMASLLLAACNNQDENTSAGAAEESRVMGKANADVAAALAEATDKTEGSAPR